jgi:hypothetical protein
MASNRYLIRYSNGFKQHISRAERDIRIGTLEQRGPREYLSKIPFQAAIEQSTGPDYLPGAFIFEHAGHREPERLQTTKALILQLERMGFVVGSAL